MNRAHLTISAAIFLAAAGAAQAGALYSNGPNDYQNFTNATPSAPLINGGHATSDSFVLSGGGTVQSVDFALITYASEVGISAVDWSITSAASGGTSFGSGTATLTNTKLAPIAGQSTGFSEFASTFDIPSLALAAGTYWLTLDNANSLTGSVDAFWAESDGPSSASHANPFSETTELDPANYLTSGTCVTPGANGDCSQSFAINGVASALPTQPGGVPEPDVWVVMLAGFACVGRALRHPQLFSRA